MTQPLPPTAPRRMIEARKGGKQTKPNRRVKLSNGSFSVPVKATVMPNSHDLLGGAFKTLIPQWNITGYDLCSFMEQYQDPIQIGLPEHYHAALESLLVLYGLLKMTNTSNTSTVPEEIAILRQKITAEEIALKVLPDDEFDNPDSFLQTRIEPDLYDLLDTITGSTYNPTALFNLALNIDETTKRCGLSRDETIRHMQCLLNLHLRRHWTRLRYDVKAAAKMVKQCIQTKIEYRWRYLADMLEQMMMEKSRLYISEQVHQQKESVTATAVAQANKAKARKTVHVRTESQALKYTPGNDFEPESTDEDLSSRSISPVDSVLDYDHPNYPGVPNYIFPLFNYLDTLARLECVITPNNWSRLCAAVCFEPLPGDDRYDQLVFYGMWKSDPLLTKIFELREVLVQTCIFQSQNLKVSQAEREGWLVGL